MRGSAISDLAMTTFCWVPRESAPPQFRFRWRGWREVDHVATAYLAGVINETAARNVLERGEGNVVAKGHRHISPSVLRSWEGAPCRRRGLRRVRGRGRDARRRPDSPPRRRANAKQREQKLTPPCPSSPRTPTTSPDRAWKEMSRNGFQFQCLTSINGTALGLPARFLGEYMTSLRPIVILTTSSSNFVPAT